MKLSRIFAILFLLLSFAFASPAQVPDALMPVAHMQFLSATGQPLAGGFVYTYVAGTTTLQATYTDSTGLISNPNPIVLDAGGFANIWLSANTYKIVVYNAQMVQQWAVDNVSNLALLLQQGTITLSGTKTFSGTSNFTGTSNFSGTQNFSGTNNFTGPQTFSSAFSPIINSVEYVSNATTWCNSCDIGGQINAAYAALPPTGGAIGVIPNNSGVCYTFTTPIVFNTVGKYVVLFGVSTGSNNAVVDGGTCMNYTPISATSAITIDWTPLTGGGYESGAGIRNLVLLNNACATAGGCGSSAIGVNIGAANGGAHKAYFENFKVQGFGKGYNFASGDTNSVGWGITWVNSPVVWNVTGINYTIPHEQDTYISGAINSNGTGVNMAGSTFNGEFNMVGGSVDSNTVCGVSLADGQILEAEGVHWENTALIQPAYVCGGATASSKLNIDGGKAYDDCTVSCTGGVTSQNWFVAGLVNVHGLQAISFGRVSTSSVFVANTRGFFQAITNPLGDFTGGINNSTVTNASFDSSNGRSPVGNVPTFASNKIFQISANTWSSTCTLGTNCAITFGTAYTSTPVCVGTDQTAANAVKSAPSNTGVTFTGTGTDVIAWMCVGNPN